MSDKYLYPNTNVLINKANIKEQEKLENFESAMVDLSLIKLYEDGFIIKKTSNIFDIHEILFKEVYSWAGKPREINIYKEEMVINYKSVLYEDYNLINKKINELDKLLNSINWKDLKKLIDDLVKFISRLWKIHPFREGNTRTVVTYLYFLTKQNNIFLNLNLIKDNSKYFRNALVMASIGEYSNYSYLEKILSDAMSNKVISNDDFKKDNEKYKTVNNIKMSKYKFNYHALKKD